MASEGDALMGRVTEFHAKQESLVGVLIALGRKTGLCVAVEDVPKGESTSLSAVRLDYDTKDSTLKEVLDDLMKKTGAFTWQRDGKTINVIDVALKKDNPFDEKVEPFNFRGTPWDFLSLMNRKVASLQAMQLSLELIADDDAVVSVETKERLTLRQVFNRFGAKGGLRWHAEVHARQAATAAPHLAKRTIVTFMPISR